VPRTVIESVAAAVGRGDPASSAFAPVARNAAYNVAGQVLPLVVMLGAFPLLLRGLGTARFGIFSLLWAIMSAAAVVNLGLPRATTKFVAELLQSNSPGEVGRYVSTAVTLSSLLGVLLGAAVYASRGLILSRLRIPATLVPEARRAMLLVSIGVSITILLHAFRGVLEAYQRFGMINSVRVGSETFAFAAMGLLARSGKGLPAIIGSLVLFRTLAALVYTGVCVRLVPQLRFVRGAADLTISRRLLNYGLWISVSDLIGPLLAYSDRFLLSAVLSVSAVAYLSIPQEVVARVWILPISAVGAVFPVFSQLSEDRSGDRDLLYVQVVKAVALLTGPPVIVLLFCGKSLLALWLGKSLSDHSAAALRILLAGVFVAVPAPVTASLLRGIGQPRIVALLQAVEAPFYIIGLWFMVRWNGVEGAALAWSARWALHAGLLLWAACSLDVLRFSSLLKGRLGNASLVVLGALAMGAATTRLVSGPLLYGITALAIGGFILAVWAWVLTEAEKRALLVSINLRQLQTRNAG
jgi:O-antigen/teichoic acid export membrane protein